MTTDLADRARSDVPVTTARPFTVYPAVDVRGGAVVRLLKGDYDQETRYPDDPVSVSDHHSQINPKSQPCVYHWVRRPARFGSSTGFSGWPR